MSRRCRMWMRLVAEYCLIAIGLEVKSTWVHFWDWKESE